MVDFIPMSRVEVFRSPQELASRVARGDLEWVDVEAIALLEPEVDDRAYVLFTPEALANELKQTWEMAPGRERLTSHLGQLLANAPERRARIVAPGDRPDMPAVVLDQGRITGVWTLASRPWLEVVGDLARTVEQKSSDVGREPEQTAEPFSTSPSFDVSTAGPSEPLGEPAIRRTPHLDTPSEIPTQRGARFDVRVYTDKRAAAQGEESDDVIIEAPPEMRSVTVGVVLTASAHFTVDGTPYQSLEIDREHEESDRLTFSLQVAPITPPGRAAISALFVFNGRPCGRVERAWLWETAEAQPVETRSDTPSIPVHVDSLAPDLSVFVTAPRADGVHFSCAVTTRKLPHFVEPQVEDWAIPERATDFVSSRLLDVTDPDKSPQRRKRALEAAGYEFYDASPPLFKRALWELIDAGEAPRTIYIASVEPSLPWELMVPWRRRQDGQLESRSPLGVEFAIGRWVRGDSGSPPQRLAVRDAFVIAPQYADPNRQLNADAEVAYVCEHLHGTRISPATVDDLDRVFAAGTASVLHFICHGEAGKDDEILILDEEEELQSRELFPLMGFRNLIGRERPLVFLNACEVGRVVQSIMGGAGFPRVLGDLGARAVIAPLWPVDNVLAHEVAEEIYTFALSSPERSLADAVRNIRSKAYTGAEFEDSYAAYCFFGDPLTQLDLASARQP